VRIFQFFSASFALFVERRQCGLMRRLHRIGHGLTGLPISSDDDLNNPCGSNERYHSLWRRLAEQRSWMAP